MSSEKSPFEQPYAALPVTFSRDDIEQALRAAAERRAIAHLATLGVSELKNPRTESVHIDAKVRADDTVEISGAVVTIRIPITLGQMVQMTQSPRQTVLPAPDAGESPDEH